MPADVTDELAVSPPLDQELTLLERHEASPLGQVVGERLCYQAEVIELADGVRLAGALVDEGRVLERRLA